MRDETEIPEGAEWSEISCECAAPKTTTELDRLNSQIEKYEKMSSDIIDAFSIRLVHLEVSKYQMNKSIKRFKLLVYSLSVCVWFIGCWIVFQYVIYS